MPVLNIANYVEADRRSAKAGATITQGQVCYVQDDGSGNRWLFPVLDTDAAKLLPGNYGIAFKVSTDPDQVHTTSLSTGQLAELGDRRISIASGDWIVECGQGTKMEYSADLLHTSLDPDNGGALPTVNAAVHLKGGKFCAVGTGGAISSPVTGRVASVNTAAKKVTIELVYG